MKDSNKVSNINRKNIRSVFRTLSIVLALSIAFGLTGCGEEENVGTKERRTEKATSSSLGDKLEDLANGSKDDTDAVTTEATATEEETTDEPFALDGDGDMAPVEMDSIPFIYSQCSTYYENYTDGTLLYEDTDDRLKLMPGTEEDYPGIKKALDKYNYIMENPSEEFSFESMVESAKEMKENDSYFTYFYNSSKAYIQRVDSQIVSILHTFENYTGGAHGYYGCTGYNYNSSTGEEMSIEDVVGSMDDLRTAAMEVFSRDYSDLIANEPGCEEILSSSFDTPENLLWTLGPEELELYYNPYELASYAAGMQTIVIRIEDYPDLFNKGIGVSEGDWARKLSGDEVLDLNGDGIREVVSVRFNYFYDEEADYSYIDYIEVQVGENLENIDYYGYDEGEAYIAKKGENYYIYVQGSTDNDYEFIEMIDITNGDIREIGSFSGGFAAMNSDYDFGEGYFINSRGLFYDPDFFYVSVRQQYICTFDAVAPAEIGDNGEITLLQDYYDLPEDFNITSKMDLELDEVNADGEVIGKTTVPSGTIFYMYRSDNETYVDCKIEDGKYVRVIVDKSDYPLTVNGVDLYEVFDGIVFAG